MNRERWRTWAGVPGVLVAVLPKATCPVCVAAYAGAASALGLGFLLTDRILNPLILVSVAISVGSVGWNSWQLNQPVPLLVAMIGAVGVILGRMVLSVPAAVYGGVVLMLAASLWTLWSRRTRSSALVQVVPSENEGGDGG